MSELTRYWYDLGKSIYFQPVSEDWRKRGPVAIAEYWRDFFSAEPDAQVEVKEEAEGVCIAVARCPAIHHLRNHSRAIVPEFCQHCYFVTQAIAERSGWEVRIVGGAGACSQRFAPKGSFQPQDLSDIRRAEET